MKSNDLQLKNRGYLSDNDLNSFKSLSESDLLQLLINGAPHERTAGIKLLSRTKNVQYLPNFCSILLKEKKLYVKLALCEAFVILGNDSIPSLVPLMGKIGNNQHKIIKLIDLNKNSFPLPRDIIARILIRFGTSVLSFMETVLKEGEYCQVTEAIDVIGHVAWNYNDYSKEKILIDLYKNSTDNLIRWKLVRSFQSFISDSISNILETIIKNDPNEIIRKEAKRSIDRITIRKSRCGS